MKKKQQKIQLILVFIGLILIFGTYFYPTAYKKNIAEKDVPAEIEDSLSDVEGTTFENVEYKGLYDLDKNFSVKSEKAYIKNEDPDIVYMTNMYVALYLTDGRVVKIISDEGRYNKVTYDCFFEKNVTATDGETKIYSKNLDLLATESSVAIYNDVRLDYPTGSLKADKIDYDFETKYFKVSMFEDEKIKMKVIK